MWNVCLQTFRSIKMRKKLAYFLRNLQTSGVNNLRIFQSEDFQICVSVPLNIKSTVISKWNGIFTQNSTNMSFSKH